MSAPPNTCANCGAPVELSSVADSERVNARHRELLLAARRETLHLRDLIRAAVWQSAIYTCGTTTCLHPRCAAWRALMEAGK